MSSDSGLSRLQIPIQQPWFAIISRVRRALVGLAVAAFILLSGEVLHWLVTRQYLPRILVTLAGAEALALGWLVFQILTNIQQRYQATIDRMRRIAELNHHIRNALRVIVHHNVPKRSGRAIQQVNEEVVRIESALREISAAVQGADALEAPMGILLSFQSCDDGTGDYTLCLDSPRFSGMKRSPHSGTQWNLADPRVNERRYFASHSNVNFV